MLRNRIHLGERAAHDAVTASAADTLHRDSGTDWPVSGDETRLAYGYRGARGARGARAVDLWKMARPKRLTAGIEPGTVIRTIDGSQLIVTRVGSIAGWGTDAAGRERRWEAWEIASITP